METTWLVGGWTNPFEKYYIIQIGNLPQVTGEKNIWNHHANFQNLRLTSQMVCKKSYSKLKSMDSASWKIAVFWVPVVLDCNEEIAWMIPDVLFVCCDLYKLHPRISTARSLV